MLLLALLGCDPAVSGPQALAFDGSPDCATFDVSDAPPASFTVELWLRGDPEAFSAARPMVGWEGVFDLAQRKSDQVLFSVGDAEEGGAGATYAFTVMDGVLHHIAGTYDAADGTVRLYVDGLLAGQNEAFPGEPDAARVEFGCSRSATVGFYGVLDELRISSTVRYTDDFERPTSPFTQDADTFALFHLDEGTGSSAKSADEAYEMLVTDATWIEFDIKAEE